VDREAGTNSVAQGTMHNSGREHYFINIGRADVLGSGVRNLYKCTKMYSDDEPELIDGDVFRMIVSTHFIEKWSG